MHCAERNSAPLQSCTHSRDATQHKSVIGRAVAPPRFSWHIITGRVLGPHAVFSSRLVIALILVTRVLG